MSSPHEPQPRPDLESQARAVIDKAAQQSAAARARAANADGPAGPRLTPQEAVALGRQERARREDQSPEDDAPAPLPDFEDLDDEQVAAPVREVDGHPEWARIPKGCQFPSGWTIWFVRFPAETTNTPGKGDQHPDGHRYRQCICWNLSESDEKRAGRMARDQPLRLIAEMAKGMIRVVDGHLADRRAGSGPGSVEQFWDEIGGKGRAQLQSLYLKTHTMDAEENARFFDSCIAPRTVG